MLVNVLQSTLWGNRKHLFAVFPCFHGVNTLIMASILYKMLERDAHSWVQQEPYLAHHCYSLNHQPRAKLKFKNLQGF